MEKIVNSLCNKLKQHRIKHLAVVLIFFSVLVMMVLLCVHFQLIGTTLAETDSSEEETRQSESVSFTASDGDVTVWVIAPEGALPEGAALSVTIIDEDSEDYDVAAEAVGCEEDTDMAVLDITFTADGVEVEPSCAVTVTIDASSLMPEDADASTLEVLHLEESSEGITPVLVADATEDTEGTVDTENAVAEFTVESFSTFTLTWTATGSYKATIDVTVYTLEDASSTPEEITDATSSTYTIGTGNTTITIADLVDAISCTSLDDYEYSYSTITYNTNTYGSNTDSVTSVAVSYSGNILSRTYLATIYTVTNPTTGETGPSTTANILNPTADYFTINLYYTKVATSTTASLTINKYEKDTTIELEGAIFTLESSNADLSTVTAGNVTFTFQTADSITFTTTDTAITFDNLPEGTYTLTETTAPTGYYAADAVSFTVANGEVAYNGDTVDSITIEDEPKTAMLTITKIYVNADGTEITGEDLSSLEASFTLEDENGNEVGTGTTTGDEGTWEVGKFGDGTYTLTETKAPDGYDKSDNITITIEDGKIYVDGSEVSTVTVANKKNITLTVVKNYVSSNGNTIDVSEDNNAYATFTLESTGDTDAYSTSVTITGAGQGTFTGLAYNGTYTLSESTAASGYTAADDVKIEVINGATYIVEDNDRTETDTVYMTNTDETHPLAGMSYAIANLNSTYKYAMQTDTSTNSNANGGLAGTAVTKVGETSDGVTIVYGEDVTIWTFEAVAGEENVYYIYATIGGTKYYLNIEACNYYASGLTVSETRQAITVTEGNTYTGQYRLWVYDGGNGTAVNWYGNNYGTYGATYGAFYGGLDKANEMLTLCEVVNTSDSLLLYNLNTSSLSLDSSSNSGWYISSYTTEGDLTWTATSGTDDDLTGTSTIQVVETGDSLTTILGKGVNGYYTYVSGQRLSLAKQMISDGKSPGKEFRFDYWTATDISGNTCYFAEAAEISNIDSDGYIYITDIDGVECTLASGTTLTAHWTEVSDIVMFFVNYSGTVLDIEGNVSGRNQQQFTGIVAIGHIYFGTVTVGSDSTFAADADAKIRSYFAYEPSYTDVVEIVIDYATIYENGKTTIYNLAEGINDSMLDEYLLAYIRNSGITIKISTADGTNPAIENENATTENYSVRWYVVKQQVDGWHIDGVMVANTSEMTVTKTFSGLTEDQVNYILGLDTGNTNSAPFNIPILLGEDKQTYVTMYAEDPTDNNGVTANGVYDYDGKESDILSYQWTVHTITNEQYTLEEAGYNLDGYDVATIAVHYYLDENGEEQYESAYTTTSADLTTQILGGTSTGFSFNNFYTEEDTGMLMIVKTDGNGLNLSGATFTLTADGATSGTEKITNANGLAFFNDLAAGTYYLAETAAPEGYQDNDTTWKVVVEVNSGDVTVTIYESTGNGTYSDTGTLCYSSASSYIYNYEIVNETEDTTVTITKTFGGELTYAQLQEIYEASTSDNDLATNPSGSSYSRSPYYIELTDDIGNTQKLYLQNATRAQTGFSFTWILSDIDPDKTWTITEYNYIYATYIDTTVVATVDDTTTPTVTVEDTGTDRYAWFETNFSDKSSDTVLITNTYTNYFTLSLSKVDSDTKEPLQGAEFKIYGAYSEATDVDDQITYKDGNGTTQTLYYINTITSDENGLATISGLRLSDTTNTFAYVLNESAAPSGYVLSTDVTVITVSINSSNYDTGVYSVEIPNSKSESGLPSTGGFGVSFYILTGLLLIGCAMLLMRRRKF